MGLIDNFPPTLSRYSYTFEYKSNYYELISNRSNTFLWEVTTSGSKIRQIRQADGWTSPEFAYDWAITAIWQYHEPLYYRREEKKATALLRDIVKDIQQFLGDER